jgi:hypothetical protein
MLVAALTTGFSFMTSAFMDLSVHLAPYGFSNNFILGLSSFVAIASILGVEGFIVVTGIREGLEKTEEQLSSRRLIASFLLLAVSIVAGLRQRAYSLSGGVTGYVEWIMAFVAAIGVPVAILLASPYLGMMINYQDIRYRKWLEEARRMFKASKYYRAAMQGLNVEPRPAQVVEPRRHERARVNTGEIVAEYREVHGLSRSDPISAARVAEYYYQSRQLTPVNGDMNDAYRDFGGASRKFLQRVGGMWNGHSMGKASLYRARISAEKNLASPSRNMHMLYPPWGVLGTACCRPRGR